MRSVIVGQNGNNNQLGSDSESWKINFIAEKDYVLCCHNEHRCLPFFFIVQGPQEKICHIVLSLHIES